MLLQTDVVAAPTASEARVTLANDGGMVKLVQKFSMPAEPLETFRMREETFVM